jgi:hypothetical protein
MKFGPFQSKSERPTSTPGTKHGNSVGNYEKMSGHLPDGTATAERSTGVDAAGREPIDPRMPNLPPA